MKPLGSLFGIRIRIHWSGYLLVVIFSLADPFGLVAFNFLVYLILGLIFVALGIGSLLTHEMAHCLVAKRLGIRVHSIVIFLFGMWAEIDEREFKRSIQEFLIAGVGPITSFVLSCLFWAASGFLAAGEMNIKWALFSIFERLAYLNLAWSLVNFIPAFPLDGGRVLHSLFWSRVGRSRATNYSTLLALILVLVFLIWAGYKVVFAGQFSYLGPMVVSLLVAFLAFQYRRSDD